MAQTTTATLITLVSWWNNIIFSVRHGIDALNKHKRPFSHNRKWEKHVLGDEMNAEPRLGARQKWRKRYRHSKTWMPFCLFSWCSCEYWGEIVIILWRVVFMACRIPAWKRWCFFIPTTTASLCRSSVQWYLRRSIYCQHASFRREFIARDYFCSLFSPPFPCQLPRWCVYAFNFYYLMCAVNEFSFFIYTF